MSCWESASRNIHSTTLENKKIENQNQHVIFTYNLNRSTCRHWNVQGYQCITLLQKMSGKVSHQRMSLVIWSGWYNTSCWPLLLSYQQDKTKLIIMIWEKKTTDPPILGRKPDLVVINKKKQTCQLVDFIVTTDCRVKIKEREKIQEISGLCQRVKKKRVMEYEGSSKTYHSQHIQNNHKGHRKENGGTKNPRNNWEYQDHRITVIS